MTMLSSLITFMKKRPALHSAVEVRYLKGLQSYGVKVRTDRRKARIIAELNAMGVKPRLRRKMGSVRPTEWVRSVRYGTYYLRKCT